MHTKAFSAALFCTATVIAVLAASNHAFLVGLAGVALLLYLAAAVLWLRRSKPPQPSIEAERSLTQTLLGEISHAGQKLLGKLNAIDAQEGDHTAKEYWQAQVQAWTDWADRIIEWRLPHMRAAFANEAGRDASDYVGTKWQRDLQTWMGVRMLRLNEFTLRARELQGDLGVEPDDTAKAPPVNPDAAKLANEAPPRRQARGVLGAQHNLAAVGGTTITCSCGWQGGGPEFAAHQRGDAAPS